MNTKQITVRLIFGSDPLQTDLIEYEPEVTTERDSQHQNIHLSTDVAPVLYPIYTVSIINHSSGGYCLALTNEAPAQLQAGEIIALRETKEKSWVTAVIRWVRQAASHTTQIGIELIAPNAQPCGLQLLRSSGQPSSFLRALLVPAIPALSRPTSVIAPRVPFQEGHKVAINQYGKELKAVLTKRSIHTGSISQFEYRLTTPTQAVDERTTSTGSDLSRSEDFDSLWKSL